MTRSLPVFTTLATAVLVLLLAAPAGAEPPLARHVVEAVADGAAPRILVRWNQLEGPRRFTHYDVMRRRADDAAPVRLNPAPVGALTTAAGIEAVFTAPGRGEILAAILETFGASYAEKLLQLANPAPGTSEPAQARLLPDLNYGAALALGLGYLDEAVVPGTTYVYEVWGLDSKGFRMERLGRATATALSPELPPAPSSLACVEIGDERGHMAAMLRWQNSAAAPGRTVAGYDVYRARRNPGGSCPPIVPGLPGVQKVNEVPQTTRAAGRPRAGEQLFAANCAVCHPGGRTAPPVAASTTDDFLRRRFPKLWANSTQATHNTAGLNALGPEDLQAIYDYVHEFNSRDDATTTPSEPLIAGETYCYQVHPRDLLGRNGPSPAPAECTVRDRVPPEVPYRLGARRVPGGAGYETCEIAWDRNADADTNRYRLFRAAEVPRRDYQAPTTPLAQIDHAGAPARITFLDPGLGAADAGESFFYAVRAVDQSGNLSDFSAWVPCVPRDIAPPGAASLDTACGKNPEGPCDCRDLGAESAWRGAGGDPDFRVVDPRTCPPAFLPSAPGDPFTYRVDRSFDGTNYEAGPETAGQFDLDFSPSTDSPVFIKVIPLDKSGNPGGASSPLKWIMKGFPLPAPRIISVADAGGGKVKIKFRSLPPKSLVGFAFYKQYQGPNDPDPTAPEHVVTTPSANLGQEFSPGQWAVKAGAVPLADLPGFIRTTDPGNGAFCYYNDLDEYYVLQDEAGTLDDLVLRLHAIGWSGKEGFTAPYAWDGLPPADGFLEWPAFRSANTLPQVLQNDLSLSLLSSPLRVKLTWTARPSGCDQGNERPFVVFRKRGSGMYQQISPPFTCNTGAPDPTAMSYTDSDIEPGMSYRYIVIRTDAQGEFQMNFSAGPIAVP